MKLKFDFSLVLYIAIGRLYKDSGGGVVTLFSRATFANRVATIPYIRSSTQAGEEDSLLRN